MDKEEFLAWLLVTDRERLDLHELRSVAAQVEVKDDEDPEFQDALQALHHDPEFELTEAFQWPEQFSTREWVDDVTRLQEEMLSLAESLERSKWYTESLVELEEALAEDDEALVDELEERLLHSWETYAAMPVLPSEATAETVVGHAFLKQGFGYWMDALDCFRAGESQDDVLWLAEQGNRYLVTVQQIVKLL